MLAEERRRHTQTPTRTKLQRESIEAEGIGLLARVNKESASGNFQFLSFRQRSWPFPRPSGETFIPFYDSLLVGRSDSKDFGSEAEVYKRFLSELEEMGFSEDQATKALINSGNSSVEAAIDWIADHENDAAASDMQTVVTDIEIEAANPFHISDQVRLKAQELRKRAQRKRDEAERKLEREREKERIQAGKELQEMKRMAEENERKRFLSLRKAEKEEERRAREKVHQKLQQDKAERRGILGVRREDPVPRQPEKLLGQELKQLPPAEPAELAIKHASNAELVGKYLRSLKRRNQDNKAKVARALQTLLIYVRNVINNPNEEKFRRIRLSNPAFQDRVGKFKEGVEFLELCGFEKVDESKYFFLPKESIDMGVLKVAEAELINALTNPYYGLLST